MNDDQQPIAQANQAPIAPAPVAPAPAAAPQPAQPVVSERTGEQFDKLVESNRRLHEEMGLLRTEMANRQQFNQTFAPIQQAPVAPAPVAQPQVNPRDFIETDPQTGDRFINEDKLQARLNELQEKATRAEQVVNNYVQQADQREIERQNREAFIAFPELNPDAQQFDRNFHNQTRAIIYDSLINPQDYGNQTLQFIEAANFVKSQLQAGQPAPQVSPEAEAAAAQAAAQDSADLRQQASVDLSGQPAESRIAVADEGYYRAIREATRKGDDEALAARILSIDHTGTPPVREGA